MALEFIIVPLLSIAFYFFTVRRGSLTRGGAVSAIGIALAVTFTVGSFYLLPLLAFFLSSVAIGKFLPVTNQSTDAKHGKGRDAIQVLANGGLYAAIAILAWNSHRYGALNDGILYLIDPYPKESYLYGLYAIAAMATADTWSSEVGQYFGGRTYDLIRWQAVPPGLSGGVSVPGTIAGLGGALGIGVLSLTDPNHLNLNVVIITAIGFLGMLIDSVLGSLLQVKYRDPKTDRILDAPSPKSLQISGIPFVNNDAVNFLSLLLGINLFNWVLLPLFGYYPMTWFIGCGLR